MSDNQRTLFTNLKQLTIMKATITFTTKKEIASVTLPNCVELDLYQMEFKQYSMLFISHTIGHYDCQVDLSDLKEKLDRKLEGYIVYSSKDKQPLHLAESVNMCTRKNNTDTIYTFYEEVEETIELTSYEQGCNVLKDIFHSC